MIGILAGIGALCVLTAVLLLVTVIICDCRENSEEERNPGHNAICALTDEKCIYTDERQMCYGCPIAEESKEIKKYGNR